MKRLVVATSTFPLRPDDGLPRFVFDLAAALGAHYEVTVLAPGAGGAPPSERWGDLAVERFDYFWPRDWQGLAYGDGMRENLRRSWRVRLQPLPFLGAQLRALRALVRAGAGVVNTHWLVPQGLSAALLRAAGLRFRHVLSVHAGDVYLLQRLPGGAALSRFVLAHTDAVLADGSAVRDSLDELAGRPSGARVQPMGVHTAAFAAPAPPAPSPFPGGFVLFVGRLVEKKGVIHLLRAMPLVRRLQPELGLVVLGDGPLLESLRAEAAALRLSEAVHFAGRASHAEVIRWLQACRAAAFPSTVDSRGEVDGMPTVILEAMAAGARVAASAVDGIPDVVRDGVNGFLCRDADPADLAAAITRALAADPGVIAAARATAEHHDWPRVAARYREVLDG